MNIELDWEFRELSRAMQDLRSATGEEMPDLCNETAKFVAINAYKEAVGARAQEIRSELNKPSSGNPRYTLAEAIIAKNARATGSWPAGKRGVKRAARAFVAKRARSNNWLKAGFVPAFQAFGNRGGVKKFKNPPGDATRAREGRRPTAVIQHFDEGINDKYPNVLPNAVRKQSNFLQRLAVSKLKKAKKRSGFR